MERATPMWRRRIAAFASLRFGSSHASVAATFFNRGPKLRKCTRNFPHKFVVTSDLKRGPWADNRNMPTSDLYSTAFVIEHIVDTVSLGGHVLITVGPTSAGTIRPVIEERLREIGKWLRVNSEAIFDTTIWTKSKDAHRKKTWYMSIWKKKMESRPIRLANFTQISTLYAIFMDWPKNNVIELESVAALLRESDDNIEIRFLRGGGKKEELEWEFEDGLVLITLPNYLSVKSEHAWTLEFTAP